jgi:hypothetical protein
MEKTHGGEGKWEVMVKLNRADDECSLLKILPESMMVCLFVSFYAFFNSISVI